MTMITGVTAPRRLLHPVSTRTFHTERDEESSPLSLMLLLRGAAAALCITCAATCGPRTGCPPLSLESSSSREGG